MVTENATMLNFDQRPVPHDMVIESKSLTYFSSIFVNYFKLIDQMIIILLNQIFHVVQNYFQTDLFSNENIHFFFTKITLLGLLKFRIILGIKCPFAFVLSNN